MNNQDQATLLEAIGLLGSAYQKMFLDNERVGTFMAMLADLPADRLATTIRYWIANEKEPPTIADLRRDCILRKINPPEPQEALNQAIVNRPQHDLVQHAIATVNMGPRDIDRNPGVFINLYRGVVEKEIREFNEFSLDEYRQRNGQAVPGDGEPHPRVGGYDLPARLLGGAPDRVGRAQDDHTPATTGNQPVNEAGPSVAGGVVRADG